MANAFQDQLLKAGLVSKDKLNKTNKSKHKQLKQQAKNTLTEADEIKQRAKETAQAKAEHDRKLNRQRLEAENKKALIAQIRQLVAMNLVDDDKGDVAYNFEDSHLVKHIYVSEELRRSIVNGRLAIVRHDEGYALVPRPVAEKIIQRDRGFVVLLNDATQSSAEDDEYADFIVPDDLMW